MKKLFAQILLLACVLLIGCDKDEETNSSYFIYSDAEYALSKGYLFYKGEESTGVYEMNLILCSSGISYSEDYGDVVGSGNLVFISLFSSSSVEIPSGTYTYSDDNTANTFDYGIIYMDYSLEETTGSYSLISDGTITVEKTGTTYTISFDCLNYTQNAISGKYKGTLSYYDLSEK